MGADANKDVVRRFFRTLCEGRIDEAAELALPDCVWWVQGMGEFDLPTVKGFWTPFAAAPGPDAMKITSMTAEDDRVAAEIVSDFKLPDGRDYQNTFFTLFTIRDGRIAKVREYFDTAYVQALRSA